MAHYIAYATEAGTRLPQTMKEQVVSMLTAGLWGVPGSAQLKTKLLPGDGLIIAIGSPYRNSSATQCSVPDTADSPTPSSPLYPQDSNSIMA